MVIRQHKTPLTYDRSVYGCLDIGLTVFTVIVNVGVRFIWLIGGYYFRPTARMTLKRLQSSPVQR